MYVCIYIYIYVDIYIYTVYIDPWCVWNIANIAIYIYIIRWQIHHPDIIFTMHQVAGKLLPLRWGQEFEWKAGLLKDHSLYYELIYICLWGLENLVSFEHYLIHFCLNRTLLHFMQISTTVVWTWPSELLLARRLGAGFERLDESSWSNMVVQICLI